MSIDITNSSMTRIAEARHIRVNGYRGVGAYTAVVTLDLSLTAVKTRTELRRLAIRLRLPPDRGGGIIGSGELEDHGIISLLEYATQRNVSFLVPLSPHQVAALEQYRSGGDLQMAVWLFGEIWKDATCEHFATTGTITVTQQEWLAALQEMGFRRTLLFGLTLPDPEDENTKALASLLDAARAHLLKGHYDESVASCRKAIELIEKKNVDQVAARRARKKYEESREEMDVHERLLMVREVLKNVSHLGVHYNESPGFSRDQAYTVLGMTVALLSSAFTWEG